MDKPTLNNQAIIVLGMHRSGTSALTRVLNMHGVELGSRLMAPAKGDNETGYWEHQDIVDIHDDILRTLDASWHSQTLPEQWWTKESLKPHCEKLATVLRRDFSQCPLWGVKDPRMCRLLPIWLPLLKELNCEPIFVLAFRHPMEVANSLHKRGGFPLPMGELLWLQHALLMERDTRGLSRTVVGYEQLLSDWKGVVEKVRSTSNAPWPKTPVEGEVEQFLKPTLRHHEAAELSRLSPWTRQAHEAFLKGSEGDSAALIKELDSVFCAYESIQLFLESLQAGLRAAESSICELQSKNQSLEHTTNWQADVINSAVRWQARSWLRRATRRWRPPPEIHPGKVN